MQGHSEEMNEQSICFSSKRINFEENQKQLKKMLVGFVVNML